MAILAKSTAHNRAFLMVQSADHITGITGATVTVTLSKNGGSFGAAGGSVTEISSGWYYVALNTTDTGTAGDLSVHCTATSADPTDFVDQVVDPTVVTLGANLVNVAGSAVSTSSAQLGVNAVNIAGQAAAVDGNNLLKVDVEDINGNATAAVALNNSTNSICWGTCSSGSTSTAVVSTLNNPSSLTDAGQLIGRTIIFLGTTTTANVRSQASNITASTTGSTPTITFTAMTHAPANGDVFVIL
jgi:hypothetical protein